MLTRAITIMRSSVNRGERLISRARKRQATAIAASRGNMILNMTVTLESEEYNMIGVSVHVADVG